MIFTSELDVELVDCSADDQDVVQAMLVSTQGKDSLEANATLGRINFLMKNRHGTPFEHNMFKFYIAAPIFVFREFHRHRIGWSYNEESGRYKQLEPKFYIPGEDRDLVQIGKPGAYTYIPGTDIQLELVRTTLQLSYEQSYRDYEGLLRGGVAKEVARMCLPVAIYSSMYATCNARSLMAFLSLRQQHEAYWQEHNSSIGEVTYRINPDGGAMFPSKPMKEINIVADKMEELFAQAMPMTHLAFTENGYVAP